MTTLRPLLAIFATSFRAAGRRAVFSVALFILNGLSVPVFAACLGGLAAALASGNTGATTSLAVVCGFAAGCRMVVGELAWRSGQRVEEETAYVLDRDILDMVMAMPSIDHHERPEYLDKLEQLRSENWLLSQSVLVIFMSASLLFQTVGTVVVLAAIDWRLFALILFAVPEIVAGGRAERRRSRNAEGLRAQWRHSDEVVRLITEPGPAKEVRVFGLGDELLRRHARSSQASFDQEFGDRMWGAKYIALGRFIFCLGFIGAIALVAQSVVAGDAGVGTLVTAVTLCAGLLAQATAVTRQAAWLSWCLTAVRRWLWLLDYGRDHNERATLDAPPAIKDGIRFENVTFAYPGNEERTILHDVDLTLPSGSTVAIIGDNGAGKTTLVKLLTGMYRPTTGRITVDGVDLATVNVDDWRTKLSAAFQDHVRLETAAQESVGLGDRPRSDDRPAVLNAVDRGGATDVVHRLPLGLDTQLGARWEHGVDLSGGQWQKLALARSMMREPLALILDEPTSALDAETEHALFERFAHAAADQRARGTVTVIISHRFSTVRMADLIIVIAGGRVVEQGSHAELMAARGTYAELYGLQARAYR